MGLCESVWQLEKWHVERSLLKLLCLAKGTNRIFAWRQQLCLKGAGLVICSCDNSVETLVAALCVSFTWSVNQDKNIHCCKISTSMNTSKLNDNHNFLNCMVNLSLLFLSYKYTDTNSSEIGQRCISIDWSMTDY